LTGRWWALAALALSMLTVGLDMTVLNVALPTLATDLHASTGELQWFGASFTLVLGALIIPMGGLGDRLGRKRMLIGGLVLFGAASAACAVADTAGQLIAARAAQGIGGAAMMPLSLAMLPVLFQDRDERMRAMNIWVTSSAVGLPLGPILGGWILDNYDWGWIFLLNIPLVAVGVAALVVFLPETRSEKQQPVDVPGIGLSSAGLALLTYGLIRAGDNDWTDGLVLASLAAGVAVLAAFVAWERRAASPIVEMSLFGNRDFTVGTALSTVANFALFGLLFVMPQYFQGINGTSPLETGVRLLPMIGGLVVATRVGPTLVKRGGARPVIASGLAVCAAALGLAATTDLDTGYGFAAVWITLLGAGIGLVMPASMSVAMGALSADRAGAGSGLLQALRQVGGTIGVALLGTVLSAGYHSRLDESGLPGTATDAVRAGLGSGLATAQRLHDAALAHVVRSSFVHGMEVVFLASAALTIAGAVTAILLLPRRASGPAADAPPARVAQTEVTGGD